jgi:hypothetical protein
MGPNIIVGWTADSDDRWSVPVGLGASLTTKIFNIPMKFQAEAQYYVVKPDVLGSEWNFRFVVTPVIPNPFAKKG